MPDFVLGEVETLIDVTIPVDSGGEVRLLLDNAETIKYLGRVMRGMVQARGLVWPSQIHKNNRTVKALSKKINAAYGRYEHYETDIDEAASEEGLILLPKALKPSKTDIMDMTIAALEEQFAETQMHAMMLTLLKSNIKKVRTKGGRQALQFDNGVKVEIDEEWFDWDIEEWDIDIVDNGTVGFQKIDATKQIELEFAMVISLMNNNEEFSTEFSKVLTRAQKILEAIEYDDDLGEMTSEMDELGFRHTGTGSADDGASASRSGKRRRRASGAGVSERSGDTDAEEE